MQCRSRPRIAYVCADSGVDVFGRKGACLHVQEVIRALRRGNARVELFASRASELPPQGLAGIPLHRLPQPPRELGRASCERHQRRNNDALREQVARFGPWDAVYERYSLWSFAALEVAREHGIPAILEVNSPLIEEQALYRELIDRAAAEEVASRAFAAASAIVAVSHAVAEWLDGFPSTRGRVHVITNGVDPKRFPPPLRARAPGRPFTMGFVGDLQPWHGVGLLAEAFALLHGRDPHARLIVVGDGPERMRLERDLKESGVAHAALLVGAVPPAEVPLWLACMDVGMAPYPLTSPFHCSPLEVIEYMAAGLPVVASRIGKIAEVVYEGCCGILCPAGDAVELADAADALRRDPGLRARLGAAGREAALRRHSWDAVVERILHCAGLEAGLVERRVGLP